jgi:hypothetical protein
MNDIVLMILSALGAVAGAAAILAGLGLVLTTAGAVLGGAASFAASAAPAVICMGGVAYAASQTGYGGRG